MAGSQVGKREIQRWTSKGPLPPENQGRLFDVVLSTPMDGVGREDNHEVPPGAVMKDKGIFVLDIRRGRGSPRPMGGVVFPNEGLRGRR